VRSPRVRLSLINVTPNKRATTRVATNLEKYPVITIAFSGSKFDQPYLAMEKTSTFNPTITNVNGKKSSITILALLYFKIILILKIIFIIHSLLKKLKLQKIIYNTFLNNSFYN
jgi:hypothetical protein